MRSNTFLTVRVTILIKKEDRAEVICTRIVNMGPGQHYDVLIGPMFTILVCKCKIICAYKILFFKDGVRKERDQRYR